jgi:hypothetical protein
VLVHWAIVNNVALQSRLVVPTDSGNNVVLQSRMVDPWARVNSVVLQSTVRVWTVWYYKTQCVCGQCGSKKHSACVDSVVLHSRSVIPSHYGHYSITSRVVVHRACVKNVVLKSKVVVPWANVTNVVFHRRVVDPWECGITEHSGGFLNQCGHCCITKQSGGSLSQCGLYGGKEISLCQNKKQISVTSFTQLSMLRFSFFCSSVHCGFQQTYCTFPHDRLWHTGRGKIKCSKKISSQLYHPT